MALLPLIAALALASPARALPDSTELLMSRGVSRELATARASQLRDVRYDLHLNVVERDTARGHATVSFTLVRPGDVILDFRGPALSAVTVNGARAATSWNGAHLLIPAAALRGGTNVVEANFAALIAPAGASIIRYHDEAAKSDYLYTLLVPSDANALFPCFDQPDLKARLTLDLTVPQGWTALANGETDRVEQAGNAMRLYFRTSDPLPTYLFAFAAGPWSTIRGRGRNTPLWVRTARLKEVEADSLQDQVASALDSFERYFGVKYPFQQFQHLLAPAFPFGGMEHPGVTMFNEDGFIYREPPTLPQRLGRRATIYHEVAHQWFGDYVTMRWFDDLWLKEGFATYMAAKMQDIESRTGGARATRTAPSPWMSFYLRNKPLAYDVDRSAGTTPVWQQLANLDQAKSNYGPIVYNKAPGILKQLNYLVGDSAFRAGVHDFLVTHAYGNATWRDLLASIGKAAHRDLVPWGEQYILRPGMPVIEQQLTLRDGRIERLALAQRPAQALSGADAWPLRTEVVLWRAGQPSVSIPVEASEASTVVKQAAGLPAPDFVFANANDYAYALVLLDDRSAAWLESHIGEVGDTFLRGMLWGAMFDLVREARLSPERLVAMAVRELPRERDEQLASGIVGRIGRAMGAYLSDAQRDAWQPRVEALLLAQAADSARPYGIRKSALDLYVDLARTPASIARLTAWLDSSSTAGIPLRQPTRWAIVTTLTARAVPGAATLVTREAARDTITGRRRAFIAGAAVPSAEVKRDYFARYFADTTLNEEWATASQRAFNDGDQAALTLPFLTPALDSLEWIQRNRRIFYLGSWISAFMGGQHSAEALRAVDAFLASHPALPADLRQKVLQSRDELERTVRIRERFVVLSEAKDLAPARNGQILRSAQDDRGAAQDDRGAAQDDKTGDAILRDFHFASGEVLPELRIHYTTLGRPRRDAQGVVRNAVLMLHGTTGSGTGLVAPMSSLFRPGDLLDTTQYYVILPDGIGHGRSSKPSDGMRMRFPRYTYDDMVQAQYRLLTESLGVNHLRLVMGTSMGCMHAWVWGETHRDFADGLVPLACAPTAIAGRNRMIRRMIIDDIMNDPDWKGGDYATPPLHGMRAAMGQLFIMTSAPLVQQRQAPTRVAADSAIMAYLDRQSRALDANDVIYAFEASREYDPSPRLESITAPVLAINSADDFVNPPELGLMEKLIPRVKHARYVLIPTSERTRGHGTHSQPAVWHDQLAEFLRTLPPQ